MDASVLILLGPLSLCCRNDSVMNRVIPPFYECCASLLTPRREILLWVKRACDTISFWHSPSSSETGGGILEKNASRYPLEPRPCPAGLNDDGEAALDRALIPTGGAYDVVNFVTHSRAPGNIFLMLQEFEDKDDDRFCWSFSCVDLVVNGSSSSSSRVSPGRRWSHRIPNYNLFVWMAVSPDGCSVYFPSSPTEVQKVSASTGQRLEVIVLPAPVPEAEGDATLRGVMCGSNEDSLVWHFVGASAPGSLDFDHVFTLTTKQQHVLSSFSFRGDHDSQAVPHVDHRHFVILRFERDVRQARISVVEFRSLADLSLTRTVRPGYLFQSLVPLHSQPEYLVGAAYRGAVVVNESCKSSEDLIEGAVQVKPLLL